MMREPSDVEPALLKLWEAYTQQELQTELEARTYQVDALLCRPSGLEQVDPHLLSEAVRRDPRSIYVPDDRVDLYDVDDPNILRLAESVVLLVPANTLVRQPNGTYDLSTITYQRSVNLCFGERFAYQPVVADPNAGTGFFITPSCIATAGHLVEGRTITDLLFVTGFKMRSESVPVTNFRADQVFRGVQLIRARFTPRDEDFAIVQVVCLGKGVGVPLSITAASSVSQGDSVFVIGHPAGLPLKYAPNSAVRDVTPRNYFISNLDVLGGSSGSPVFDVTNTVVGIQVRGGPDYMQSPQGCNQLARCPDTGCGGEDAQRITGVVGPVRDLSVVLEIGNGGIWSGRHVYIRLKKGAPLFELPQTKFDSWKSYRFALDPATMGIGTSEDINLIEIYSPWRQNPYSWDEWTLYKAVVLVNGDQELHNLTANHTFPDKGASSDETWSHSILSLPDNYILSPVIFGEGSTPSGNTAWKVYTDSNNNSPLGLYVDVDTRAIGFTAPPLYFPSLGGDGSHWLAQGVTAIYAPTAQGFRVYIKYPIDFTPQQANQLKWHVNWVGIQAS